MHDSKWSYIIVEMMEKSVKMEQTEPFDIVYSFTGRTSDTLTLRRCLSMLRWCLIVEEVPQWLSGT